MKVHIAAGNNVENYKKTIVQLEAKLKDNPVEEEEEWSPWLKTRLTQLIHYT